MAAGYESVLEATFSVGKPARELKGTRPPNKYGGWHIPVHCLHPTITIKENKVEILSKETEREGDGEEGWIEKNRVDG